MAPNLIQLSVSGKTSIVPVIGHPINQAKSPALLSERATQAGHDTIFVPADIHPDGLGAAMEGFRQLRNLVGVVITIPHKSTVLELVDESSEAARIVGSANVVRAEPDGRWVADILDGKGLVRGLFQAEVAMNESTVQIIGCGGAGAAVAYAVAQAGASEVWVADVLPEKADALISRLDELRLPTKFGTGEEALRTADIVINASPVGMHGQGGAPFDTDQLSPRQVVVDMVMEPAETALLAAAHSKGCTTVPGLATLNGQADKIMEFLDLLPAAENTAQLTKSTTKVSKEKNLCS